MVDIELYPLGKKISVKKGTPLKDILLEYGIEFPCGGEGICKGCLVKLLEGNIEINERQREVLLEKEIENGLRLACQGVVTESVKIEIPQWEMEILSDTSEVKVESKEGLGIAVDLGTTTLVAQILDLRDGDVIGVKTTINPQAKYGSDIMTRIQYAIFNKGEVELRNMIRSRIYKLIKELLEEVKNFNLPLLYVVIVGNSAMHNLFCGVNIKALSEYPYNPEYKDLFIFTPKDLAWDLPQNVKIIFLPCIGGFVGSDILAGIISTEMYKGSSINGLIDIGTNGEIVFGNKDKIICASAAAGPAFEGAKISMGTRAVTGAISKVILDDGHLKCEVIGGGKPKGICGSGLVDAVASALKLGLISPTGRLQNGKEYFEVAPPVVITQKDIRELQLAKGAIATGITLLLKELNLSANEVEKVYLAGAFGNYINAKSAKDIGLFDFDENKVEYSGNTALKGAKMSLFAADYNYREILKVCQHISLASSPEFQNVFAENMLFSH
jgi:uncharacterized 2Fe-2S/4Fe-4S cluster protein (DUF4445 family)